MISNDLNCLHCLHCLQMFRILESTAIIIGIWFCPPVRVSRPDEGREVLAAGMIRWQCIYEPTIGIGKGIAPKWVLSCAGVLGVGTLTPFPCSGRQHAHPKSSHEDTLSKDIYHMSKKMGGLHVHLFRKATFLSDIRLLWDSPQVKHCVHIAWLWARVLRRLSVLLGDIAH